jgi:type IV secretion system protein VirB6
MGQIINYDEIVNWLFEEVHVLTDDYVNLAYHALDKTLAQPILLAMTLYIVILGICITQGWIQLSFSNLVKVTLKLAIIFSFAMNWDIFSNYVVNMVVNGSSELGNALIKASPLTKPNLGNATIQNALQDLLDSITLIGQKIFEKGSFHNFTPYICGLFVWGFGYILIIVATMELLCSQVLLALMLALAPLFIGFTLFKSMHGLCDRWLGQIAGYALIQILVSATVGFVLVIAEQVIPIKIVADAIDVKDLNLVSFVPLMLMSLLSIGIILRSANIAMNLGNAVGTISGSYLMAGFATRAIKTGAAGSTAIGTTISTFSSAVNTSQKIGESIGKGIGNTIESIRNKLRQG